MSEEETWVDDTCDNNFFYSSIKDYVIFYLKMFLYMSNSLICLCCVLLLFFALFLIVNWNFADQMFQMSVIPIFFAYFLIYFTVMGSVMFLGCLGSGHENRFVLLLFVMMATALLIALLYVSSQWLKDPDTVINKIVMGKFNDTLVEFNENDQKFWNKIHSAWRCCGKTNYTEWEQFLSKKKIKGKVLHSCCVEPAIKCENNVTTENVYTDGCSQVVLNFLKENRLLARVLVVLVFLFLYVSILIAIALIFVLPKLSPYGEDVNYTCGC